MAQQLPAGVEAPRYPCGHVRDFWNTRVVKGIFRCYECTKRTKRSTETKEAP